MDQPVPLLVLGAGQRCGSTVIQRLLCSHPQVRVWGEHAAQLRALLTLTQRLRRWTESTGRAGRQELTDHGHQGFIANLTPESPDIDAAAAAFVDTLFGQPARTAGRPIWGVKEVHYRLAEVLVLRRLFPHLRAIVIVRDPRGVLRSLDEWERHGGWSRTRTEQCVRDWCDVAGSFVPAEDDTQLRGFILPIRYEDLVAHPAGWIQAIAEHCALDAALLDPSVFDHRVHTVGTTGRIQRRLRAWSELPPSLRALVDDEVRGVAAAYGYDL